MAKEEADPSPIRASRVCAQDDSGRRRGESERDRRCALSGWQRKATAIATARATANKKSRRDASATGQRQKPIAVWFAMLGRILRGGFWQRRGRGNLLRRRSRHRRRQQRGQRRKREEPTLENRGWGARLGMTTRSNGERRVAEKRIPHPTALRAYGLRMTARGAVASDHDIADDDGKGNGDGDGNGNGGSEKNPPLRTEGGAPAGHDRLST